MRLSKYQLSLADALQNNATKNIIIAVLLGTNFLSVWGWFSSTETIVLVPPTLDERVIVSADDASAGYKTAWGLYVAELLGNITPGNSDFVGAHIGEIFAPAAYRTLRDTILNQIEAISEDRITVRFEPREVSYEGETEKVFVYGSFTSAGPSGEPDQFERTFEVRVDMRFGRPWVTHFAAYEEPPRTIEALERARAEAEAQMQAQAGG